MLLALVGTLHATDAGACGCFAPPVVPDAFAVNQRAEQVIFEVSEGTITVHVRILYEGDPAEFAWLLPMPNVPDIALSETALFSFVDQQTAPTLTVTTDDICPEQAYTCRTHPGCSNYYDDDTADDDAADDDVAADDDAFGGSPPVTVLASARVGAYDTITFAADEAELAIVWLNDNGFIVNETMSPYMQPYLDSGMVFVASKLVPGASDEEIRPLSLTYQAEFPAIPLRLTAIAAEPHMTVTAFIYADSEYEPATARMVHVPARELTNDGRSNYPMLLARLVDEQGGFAFVEEYSGDAPRFQDSTGCCGEASPELGVVSEVPDFCGLGDDGACQCPGASFDAPDCEGLLEGLQIAHEIADRHPVLTRLTTRISPEEMIEDPLFRPHAARTNRSRLNLAGSVLSLASCEAQIEDTEEYESITRDQRCAATYCDFGECVLAGGRPGCRCDEGFVARVFVDTDNRRSITCVPEVPPVDFAAGGLELASPCDELEVDAGECVDLGGFVGVRCAGTHGAFVPRAGESERNAAVCLAVTQATSTPGAMNYSRALSELDVCAPAPPQCPASGWLQKRYVERPGKDCGTTPDPSWLVPADEPVCETEEADDDGDVADTPPDPVVTTLVDTREPRPTPESEPPAESRACALAQGRSAPPPSPWVLLLGAVLLLVPRWRAAVRRP